MAIDNIGLSFPPKKIASSSQENTGGALGDVDVNVVNAAPVESLQFSQKAAKTPWKTMSSHG